MPCVSSRPRACRAGPLADGTLWSAASGGLAVGDESQGFVEVLIRQLPDEVEASLAHRGVDLPHVAVVQLPKLLDVIHLTRLTSGEPLARHDGTAASSVHLRGTGAPEAVRLCQMPGSRDRRSPSFSSVTPGRSLSNSASPIGALSARGPAPWEWSSPTTAVSSTSGGAVASTTSVSGAGGASTTSTVFSFSFDPLRAAATAAAPAATAATPATAALPETPALPLSP